MKIKIEKRYLIIPTNTHAVSKKLCFFEGEGESRRLVMDFDCKIDLLTPSYWGYLDAWAFMGRELEYECTPDMEFVPEQTDEKEIDGLYQEEYRPFIHYSPKQGYNNDPNGLIKYHGTYHLFHQYNPYDTEWGNMHWGHATSSDLLHWEEGDIALFPDTYGTMYSGSAIEDVNNVTGLQTGELTPMLLYYTGAADRNLLSIEKKRTQCMAYSLDGGKSFAKFEGNPMVDLYKNWGGNRDPKVVWVDDLGKYVMMIYLGADQFALFASTDLLKWSFMQQLTIAREAECADIFPYMVNGKKYWVLLGASDIYVVGVFENGRFVQKTQEKQLNPAGVNYAAQSFSGMDDGRVVRIPWMKLWAPSDRFTHQMGIPVDTRLIESENGLCLAANPIDEIRSLYRESLVREAFELKDEVRVPLSRAAYDISIRAAFKGELHVRIFGHLIKFKASENLVTFIKPAKSYRDAKVPVSMDSSAIDVRIVVDRCSFELFIDGGKINVSLPYLCDYNLPYLTLCATEPLQVEKFECHKLESIHGAQN